MLDQATLDLCLSITGAFENGVPSYTDITGNFDDQGLSVGVLQWCAGQGSLGRLISRIIDLSTPEFVDQWFQVQVTPLSRMKNSAAVQFVKNNFLDNHGEPTHEAREQWGSLLGSEIGVQAQVQLAVEGPLTKAHELAGEFCPENSENPRTLAFFFDLVTQSGSMGNSRGRVLPVSVDCVDTTEAFAYAQTKPKFYNQMVSASFDDLSHHLLFYALERAKLSKPEYVWDAFSRRATIASKKGIVHGKVFDLTTVLP